MAAVSTVEEKLAAMICKEDSSASTVFIVQIAANPPSPPLNGGPAWLMLGGVNWSRTAVHQAVPGLAWIGQAAMAMASQRRLTVAATASLRQFNVAAPLVQLQRDGRPASRVSDGLKQA